MIQLELSFVHIIFSVPVYMFAKENFIIAIVLVWSNQNGNRMSSQFISNECNQFY